MKKHSQRAQRIADQIQRELADLLVNEVKDPRVGRVTITRVDVTSDLSHANVHFLDAPMLATVSTAEAPGPPGLTTSTPIFSPEAGMRITAN